MAEDRLDRIEVTLQELAAALVKLETAQTKTDLTVNRLGRYAMLIARIHEDELASLKNRVRLLEEGLSGDIITR
jgi:hypothetical protein